MTLSTTARHFIASFCLFVLSLFSAQGQDTLFLKDKSQVYGKISEVNSSEIVYKKTGYLDGPVFKTLKNEIDSIHFAGGLKEIFKNQPANSTADPYRNYNTVLNPANSSYQEGFNDADRYYRGYKTLGTASYFSGFLLSIYGLPIPLIGASTTPKNAYRYAPDLNRYQNDPIYSKGFNERAKSIKSRKAWSNYGYGAGTLAAVYLIAIIAALGSGQ